MSNARLKRKLNGKKIPHVSRGALEYLARQMEAMKRGDTQELQDMSAGTSNKLADNKEEGE